jgi:hypothetical protein
MIGALLLVSSWSSRVRAPDDRRHALTPQHHAPTPEQKKRESALVNVVREATERFQDVSVAEAEGYVLQFGCVSGSDAGRWVSIS